MSQRGSIAAVYCDSRESLQSPAADIRAALAWEALCQQRIHAAHQVRHIGGQKRNSAVLEPGRSYLKAAI